MWLSMPPAEDLAFAGDIPFPARCMMSTPRLHVRIAGFADLADLPFRIATSALTIPQ